MGIESSSHRGHLQHPCLPAEDLTDGYGQEYINWEPIDCSREHLVFNTLYVQPPIYRGCFAISTTTGWHTLALHPRLSFPGMQIRLAGYQ